MADRRARNPADTRTCGRNVNVAALGGIETIQVRRNVLHLGSKWSQKRSCTEPPTNCKQFPEETCLQILHALLRTHSSFSPFNVQYLPPPLLDNGPSSIFQTFFSNIF